MIPVTVPSEIAAGADANVVVAAWLYPEGSSVREGAVIAELMVQKASFELLAPAAGTLHIRVAAEEPFRADRVVAEIAPAGI